MLRRVAVLMPVFLLWAEMLYGLGLNLAVWLPGGGVVQNGDVPDTVFVGLQAVANGSMVLLMSWAFWVLAAVYRETDGSTVRPLGFFRITALLVVLCFSLPSWAVWAWGLWQELTGTAALSFSNIRYLITAVLLPYPAFLCLVCLLKRRGKLRQARQQAGSKA